MDSRTALIEADELRVMPINIYHKFNKVLMTILERKFILFVTDVLNARAGIDKKLALLAMALS